CTSPRIMVPGHTLASSPTVTSPIITAAGSIHALAAICGLFPRKARMSGTLANIPRGSQPRREGRLSCLYLNGDCVSRKEIESVNGCCKSYSDASGPALAGDQSICTDGP